MKKYWLYIENYVYISVKKNNVLLYNSYSGKFLEFSNNKEILRIIKRLTIPANHQVTLLNEGDMNNESIRQFIYDIRNLFMGDIIDIKCSNGKPVQISPKIKIQRDIKNLQKDNKRSIGENLMNYLSEVTLYINNSCFQNCQMCHTAYKQFICCTSKNGNECELSMSQIIEFFNEVSDRFLINMNIIGGDIFLYSSWMKLLEFLAPLKVIKTFYVHYLNLYLHQNKIIEFSKKNMRLFIPIDFPIDIDKLSSVINSLVHSGIEYYLIFLVNNYNEYEEISEIASKLPVSNKTFIPLCNGSNLSFFEQNIYYTQKDFENEPVSMKDIYKRSEINENFFGRINITPRGEVYGNFNFPKLGILGRNSIFMIIKKEMQNRLSWRKVRRFINPCNACLYSNLCPPISNYNLVSSKFDLCHINKSNL